MAAPDLNLSSDTPQIHPPLVPERYRAAADVEATTAIPVFENEESRDLITANFTHFREDPFSFLKQISLHYSGTGWRAYDHVIGRPIFYKGFSEQMKTRILRSALLRMKINELAERRATVEDDAGTFGSDSRRVIRLQKRREEIEKQLNQVADGIVDGMICKFESKRFIRVRDPGFRGCWASLTVHTNATVLLRAHTTSACNYLPARMTKAFMSHRTKFRTSGGLPPWPPRRSSP